MMAEGLNVTSAIEAYILEVKKLLPDDYTVEVATEDEKIVFDVSREGRHYRYIMETNFVETAGASALPLARDMGRRILWHLGAGWEG